MKNRSYVTAVLAAGSTASPYLYNINITSRTCCPACVTSTPVFNPVFNLVGVAVAGSNLYIATVMVEGVFSYVPYNGTSCETRSELIQQSFEIPIESTTAPTSVTIASGSATNVFSPSGCCNKSNILVTSVPITVTVA